MIRRLLVALLMLTSAMPLVSRIHAADWLATNPAAGRAIADLPLAESYAPAEARLFADAADGRLDDHDLLSAALVAGGCEDAAVRDAYRRRFDAYAAELQRSGAVTGSPRERIRAVFAFLHSRMLHGQYHQQNTTLDAAFDRGDYNCVSATILFACLAERCGMTVHGVERPGHVVGRVQFGERAVDIETTCANWFDVLERRESAGDAPALEGRELSPLGLVAAIYYNRGYEQLVRHEFAPAVEANLKALRLDPAGPAARANYLAALNNWSLDLCGQQQYETAVAILRHGFVAAPQYSAFANNFVAVHEHWATALVQQGRWDEALRQVDRAIADRPGLEGLDHLRDDLSRGVGR